MPDTPAHVTASLVAAVFLLLRQLAPDWKKWPRTVADALRLAGAGKSQAYEMLHRLQALLPTVIGKPGRPEAQASAHGNLLAVAVAVRAYIQAHPGAACGAGRRCTYSDDFRRFIVGLIAPGQPAEQMSIAELASTSGVPRGTLKAWLRPRQADVENLDAPSSPGPIDMGVITPQHAVVGVASAPAELLSADDTDVKPAADEVGAKAVPAAVAAAVPADTADGSVADTIRGTHLKQIAALWKSWRGPFQAFCKMLRTEQRMPYGDTFVGDFLQSVGLRQRRMQRPVEAPWSSDTFRTLFPGAQWLGDGTSITVRWAGEVFVFNVEALHDVGSDAATGFRISDSEDEEALRLAYSMGLETTVGVPPLCLTLDNRPSNHSPGALESVPGTIVLAATPGRGQAKAPLEGSFGLFQQAMPPLVMDDNTQREMARCFLEVVMTAWYRGRNGKPRKRLRGRTPAEAYLRACPTQEELDGALAWIHELQRRQELARRTRQARRDPVRIQLLTDVLADLGIPDPERRLAVNLAYYSREAIVRGLATFRNKLERGALPPDVDAGRYLGGIIRQLDTQLELEGLSVHLLQQRIRLRDITLAPLTREADRLRATVPAADLPQVFVDRALDAEWAVDYRFWAQAAAEALSTFHPQQRAVLYQPLCRRVAATFKTDRERREDLIDRLAQALARAA